MPTYDYECEACGHAFELFQNITAKLEKKCPKCGKRKLVRLVGTGAGLIFKGSGFYITDYKHNTKEYKGKAAEGSGKIDSAKADSAKKSEDKPKPGGEAKGKE